MNTRGLRSTRNMRRLTELYSITTWEASATNQWKQLRMQPCTVNTPANLVASRVTYSGSQWSAEMCRSASWWLLVTTKWPRSLWVLDISFSNESHVHWRSWPIESRRSDRFSVQTRFDPLHKEIRGRCSQYIKTTKHSMKVWEASDRTEWLWSHFSTIIHSDIPKTRDSLSAMVDGWIPMSWRSFSMQLISLALRTDTPRIQLWLPFRPASSGWWRWRAFHRKASVPQVAPAIDLTREEAEYARG
jgi:hypothetical protein